MSEGEPIRWIAKRFIEQSQDIRKAIYKLVENQALTTHGAFKNRRYSLAKKNKQKIKSAKTKTNSLIFNKK